MAFMVHHPIQYVGHNPLDSQQCAVLPQVLLAGANADSSSCKSTAPARLLFPAPFVPAQTCKQGGSRMHQPRLRATLTAAFPIRFGDASKALFIPVRAAGVCIRPRRASNSPLRVSSLNSAGVR